MGDPETHSGISVIKSVDFKSGPVPDLWDPGPRGIELSDSSITGGADADAARVGRAKAKARIRVESPAAFPAKGGMAEAAAAEEEEAAKMARMAATARAGERDQGRERTEPGRARGVPRRWRGRGRACPACQRPSPPRWRRREAPGDPGVPKSRGQITCALSAEIWLAVTGKWKNGTIELQVISQISLGL